MKRMMMSIAILFALMITFGQTIEGNAAYDEITSIQRIMLQASEEVVTAENELGMEIVHLEVDLLIRDNHKYVYRNLSAGWTYLIYAEGEVGMVNDFDLKVMKQDPITEKWMEVCSDTRPDFGAICVIKVEETARYAINVSVGAYANNFTGCHYFILIGHAKPE